MTSQPLTPGQKAPSIEFCDESGAASSTQAFAGRHYVVYFYPRDNTPGCTREACAFRDGWSEFARRAVPVIGVSPDKSATHERFRAKHNLPFPLASDPDHVLAKAFGAFGEKKFMGRTFDGVHRITFLIDPQGVIAAVFAGLKPEAHAARVLEAIPETATSRHGQA